MTPEPSFVPPTIVAHSKMDESFVSFSRERALFGESCSDQGLNEPFPQAEDTDQIAVCRGWNEKAVKGVIVLA